MPLFSAMTSETSGSIVYRWRYIGSAMIKVKELALGYGDFHSQLQTASVVFCVCIGGVLSSYSLEKFSAD